MSPLSIIFFVISFPFETRIWFGNKVLVTHKFYVDKHLTRLKTCFFITNNTYMKLYVSIYNQGRGLDNTEFS